MMNNKKSKFRMIFRMISVVLVQAFLMLDLVWAAGDTVLCDSRLDNLSPQINLNLDTVHGLFNGAFLAGDSGAVSGSLKELGFNAPEKEETVREKIRDVLCTADKQFALKDYDASINILKKLQGLNNEWVAEEALKFIKNKQDKPAFIPNVLLTFLTAQDRELLVPVLKQGYKAAEEGFFLDDKKAWLDIFFTLLLVSAGLTRGELDKIMGVIINGIHKHTNTRPMLERGQAGKYFSDVKISRYFDADEQYPDALYFPNDFLNKRIIMERDLAVKRKLIAFYDLTHFYRESLKVILENLVSPANKGYLFDKLFVELLSPKTALETRLFVTLVMVNNWEDELGQNRLDRLLDELVIIYAKADSDRIRDEVINNILSLSTKSEMNFYRHAAVIEIVKNDLESNIKKFAESSRLVDKADERYDLALSYKEYYSRQNLNHLARKVHKKLKQQESVAAQINSAAAVIIYMLDKSYGVKDVVAGEVFGDLSAYLFAKADDVSLDTSIRSLIVSLLTTLLETDDRGIIDFFLAKLRPMMPAELFGRYQEFFLAHGISSNDLMALLNDPRLPERAGYLLIFRHSNRDFLEKVIFNQPKNINIKFRLYAFAYYAAEFLVVKNFGAPDLYDQNKLDRMQQSLAKEAKLYLDSLADDDLRITRLFDDIWLQNEEVKIYITAVTVVLQEKTHLLEAKAYAHIADRITTAMLLDHYDNANNFFHLGVRFFKKRKHVKKMFNLFLGVIGHEVMHNVLSQEYDYNAEGLTHSVIHELLSNFAEKIVTDNPENALGVMQIDELLSTVMLDDYYTVEGHEGAIVHEAMIEKRAEFFGLRIDYLRMLLSGVSVATAKENEKDNLEKLTAKIFECYEGRYTPGPRKEQGESDIIIKSLIKKRPSDDDLKQRLLKYAQVDFHLKNIKSIADKEIQMSLLAAQGI